MNVYQRLIIALIRRYQAKGGGREVFRVDCNFEPSCSEYAKQAVMHHGVFRGMSLAFQRMKRCNKNDCTATEYDPIPTRECRHV